MKAFGVHKQRLRPLQGGEAPRSGDEGASCIARHNSQIRKKRSAFLRIHLIHRKRSPFPISRGRLLGARSPLPPLCKGGLRGDCHAALHNSCLHWIGNNPSVSLRDPPSLLTLRSRFVAAEDRALPARTIHREGKIAFSPLPPLCKGGTEGRLSRGMRRKDTVGADRIRPPHSKA